LGLVHAETEGMVLADQVFFWILEEIMLAQNAPETGARSVE